jgi:hypothetical protein
MMITCATLPGADVRWLAVLCGRYLRVQQGDKAAESDSVQLATRGQAFCFCAFLLLALNRSCAASVIEG